MWIVVQTRGSDGDVRAELNYFSTKAFALEFAIEALGNIRTKVHPNQKNSGWMYGPLKETERFDRMVNDLTRYNGTIGNGMHADDSFGIEISEVPTDPEK